MTDLGGNPKLWVEEVNPIWCQLTCELASGSTLLLGCSSPRDLAKNFRRIVRLYEGTETAESTSDGLVYINALSTPFRAYRVVDAARYTGPDVFIVWDVGSDGSVEVYQTVTMDCLKEWIAFFEDRV